MIELLFELHPPKVKKVGKILVRASDDQNGNPPIATIISNVKRPRGVYFLDAATIHRFNENRNRVISKVNRPRRVDYRGNIYRGARDGDKLQCTGGEGGMFS